MSFKRFLRRQAKGSAFPAACCPASDSITLWRLHRASCHESVPVAKVEEAWAKYRARSPQAELYERVAELPLYEQSGCLRAIKRKQRATAKVGSAHPDREKVERGLPKRKLG